MRYNTPLPWLILKCANSSQFLNPCMHTIRLTPHSSSISVKTALQTSFLFPANLCRGNPAPHQVCITQQLDVLDTLITTGRSYRRNLRNVWPPRAHVFSLGRAEACVTSGLHGTSPEDLGGKGLCGALDMAQARDRW